MSSAPMKIYNTLTRAKEGFVPLTAGEVRMYVCGVTVYDRSHIGHARSAIVFDVIRRYLEYRGFRVRFVKNYTDVDDRIIKRATDEGVEAREIAERYIDAYRRDMAALGVRPADVEPKATEHIPQMIQLIERLVADGFAYVVNGDVYYEVRRFPPYGRLSGKNLDELLAGARVEVDERKRDPRDFALWKAAKPGEPSWEGPWGPGRPGWHIECSAMAMEYLGESFDIHGGGEDLIFPHHECEIAQSEAVTGKPFARYWIHNGFVNFGSEKMSKSLGNTLAINDLLSQYSAEALRLYLARPHYKSPLPFLDLRVRQEAATIDKFNRLVDEIRPLEDHKILDLIAAARQDNTSPRLLMSSIGVKMLLDQLQALNADLAATIQQWAVDFEDAMNDDFNTPRAIAALHQMHGDIGQYRFFIAGSNAPADLSAKIATVIFIAHGRILGFFEKPRESVPSEVERLVAEREVSRKRRDWKRSDALREEIQRLGWNVEDTPTGPRLAPRSS